MLDLRKDTGKGMLELVNSSSNTSICNSAFDTVIMVIAQHQLPIYLRGVGAQWLATMAPPAYVKAKQLSCRIMF